MTTNNYLEAKRFLETLFSRYFAEHDGYVELRLVSDNNATSKWQRKGVLTEKDWEMVTKENKTQHIYFGVNPRGLDKKKKQDDIHDIICFWADVDGKDFIGGKAEALKQVKEFALPPTIVVDSGHGYHCYWGLEKPIIGITKEQRTEFKQTIAGMVDRLGADSSKLHLDACLRLPGAMNIKDPEHLIECHIVEPGEEQSYPDTQFTEFRNVKYKEPTGYGDLLPKFGEIPDVISHKNTNEMEKDMEKLVVPSRIKNLIRTGSLIRGKGSYPSRSERDEAIICSLIDWGYTYATMRSIFYNPLLGCSNRLRHQAECELQWDVRKALEYVKKAERVETAEAGRITAINHTKGLLADEKRKLKLDFITDDLLTSNNPAGRGFKDATENLYYFFDNETKTLMNFNGTDFYTFIRYRYRVPERDFNEIKSELTTVIRWQLKDAIVTPRRVSYWDKEKFILYVSDNANGIYRLDGQRIEFHDNGIDGVFFKYDPALASWMYNPEQEVVNYFVTDVEERQVDDISFPSMTKLGLNLDRFYQPDCLLNKFLVERARFSTEKNNPLTPWLQRLMLLIYFFSQFFESLLREKPVAVFIGIKESGKSFITRSIGKIFDGDSFEPSGLPKSADDLAVVMSRRPYLVLDNVDTRVGGDMLDLMSAAATGVAWRKRKLYEDGTEVTFTPHCFMVITSREPSFTRDDLVSRFLLFSTQKIDHPLGLAELIDPLLMARSDILTEVLVNLNSVIALLWLAKAQRNPIRCISRLADWETLGMAMCGSSPALWQFRFALELMNEKKDELAVENVGVYQVLYHLVYERGEQVVRLSPSALYDKLVGVAEEMKLKNFQRYCSSAGSMGKWIGHNRKELERQFEIEIFRYPNKQCEYTFKALANDPNLIIISEARMLEVSRCPTVGDLHKQLEKAVTDGGLQSWDQQENGDYRFIVKKVPEKR